MEALELKEWLGGKPGLLLCKALLCVPFVVSGLPKLAGFQSAVAEQRHFGVPAPAVFAVLVILTQLGGSALMFTSWDWLGALWIAIFTAAATWIGHPYWTYPNAAPFEQKNVFFEHAAIIGGLLAVVWLRWAGHG